MPHFVSEKEVPLERACISSGRVRMKRSRLLRSHWRHEQILQVFQKRLSIVDPPVAEFCAALEDELQWKAFQAAKAIGERSQPPSIQNLDLLKSFTATVSTSYVYEAPVPWLSGFTPSAFEGASGSSDAWDLQAPWQPWASQPDAVSAIHVECVWHSIPLQVC